MPPFTTFPVRHCPRTADDIAARLAERWNLPEDFAGVLFGSGDERDERVRMVFGVFEVLSQLLGDNAAREREWLEQKMPILDGSSPMDVWRGGQLEDLREIYDTAQMAANRY